MIALGKDSLQRDHQNNSDWLANKAEIGRSANYKQFPLEKGSSCPPNWSGELCDIPQCFRGRVDFSTKQCICEANFSPPFCTSCLKGFWGADCRNTYAQEVDSHQFTIVLALYPIAIATLILLFCCLLYYIIIETMRRRCGRPPSYSEVLLDAPPPYSQVIAVDHNAAQIYHNPKTV